MAKKLFEDVEELFVEKPTWSSETKTVGVEISEFLKKIEEKKMVESPRFKFSGVEFYIRVTPGFKGTEFVRVDLMNGSENDQTTSVTFLEESGAQASWKMHKVDSNSGRAFTEFLSHEKFKTWAKKHGDVFKLKATVTLHQKKEETGDDWIRYCNPVCLSCSWCYILVQERAQSGGAQVPWK